MIVNKRVLSVLLILLSSVIVLGQSNLSTNEIDLLLLKEDYKGAVKTIDSLLINSPDNAGLYYKLGVAYQRQYLFDNAINAFSKSIKLDSNLIAAQISMGACFNELGSNKKALSIYEKIFNSDPSNIKAGINLASALIDLHNYRYAFNVYEKMLITDSASGYIYRQLGYCAYKLDTISLSITYYKKAYKLNNNDMISLQQLVNNYIKIQYFSEAFSLLISRIEKEPENSILNQLLGDAYFSVRQYIQAITNYENAIKYGDSTSYLLQKLGISYYLNAAMIDSTELTIRTSAFRLAAETLEKAALFEDNPVTYFYLGLTYQKLGYYQESVKNYNRVLNIVIPSFVTEIYLHLGECYAMLKDYPNMVESYKGALLFNPENSDLLLHIAEVYEKGLSDNLSAIKYYKEYLDKDTLNNEMTIRVKQKLNKLKKNN